jgi:hypothetical protein
VLLVLGRQSAVEGLRHNRDTLLMEWSARELPRFEKAGLARLIFAVRSFLLPPVRYPSSPPRWPVRSLWCSSGVLNVRQASAVSTCGFS